MGQSVSTHVQSARRRLNPSSAESREEEGSDNPSRPRFHPRRSSRLLNRLVRDRSSANTARTPEQSETVQYTGSNVNLSPNAPPSPSPTNETDDTPEEPPTPVAQQPPTRRRTTSRHHSMLGDGMPSWRAAERLPRTMNPLRRRRPAASRGAMDDQIPVLSQLLSAAAAATAASLMGDDPNAVRNARGIGGDESTLESFLESLQNGRIANALARSDGGSSDDGSNQSINFVRLFRFGSSSNSNASGESSHTSTSVEDGNGSSENNNGEETPEGRMVPIIIVGIRSIPPSRSSSNAEGGREESTVPAFLDALTSFDDIPTGELLDSAGPSTPGRHSHQRRRSMGGVNPYDSQRHHQNLNQRPFRNPSPIPNAARPFSATSEEATISGPPRPPPSTPASTGLSAVSSGTTTPGTPSNVSSRRPSLAPGSDTLGNIRAAINEAGASLSTPMPSRRARRNRRSSDSDFPFGSGSSRRNGMVEPDEGEAARQDGSNAGVGSRSWIIYVLGGSYPENHPLLNTPSLFTDSPTYEDMLLLSSLLGPAKPPVASEQDIEAARGILEIKSIDNGRVVGIVSEGGEEIIWNVDERCLVCLAEYEVGEVARRLGGCGHVFHRECIDTWLTTGRNSCPLCRREGVQKKPNSNSSTTPTSPSLSPTESVPGDVNIVPSLNLPTDVDMGGT